MKLILHLGLSYACNMKCKHCFVNKSKDRFDIERIKQVISYLVESQGLFVLYYTYGEPFLSGHFETIQNFCKNLGLIQIVMSNGSIISDEDCNNLVKNGIDRVYISIDSCFPDKHDLNRGVDGAFDSAIRSIALLNSKKIRTGIATTVNENNANEIYGIASLADSLNISSLSLLRQRNFSGVVAVPDHCEYYSFFEDYISNPRHFGLFVHDSSLNPIVKNALSNGLISFQDYEKWTEMNLCHANTTVSIAPNGDVYSCNLFGNVISNIYEYDIEEIIGSLDDENFVCCTKFPGTC